MQRSARIAGVCLALLIVSCVALTNPVKAVAAPSHEPGRFSLFQGSYTTFDLKRKETYVHQAVFLLDTQTGEVKRYINKIDENGRYIETWLPTDLPSADKRRSVQEGK
ncbi:MAG: hypothetical protein OEL57_01830 [Trichlorobacter sp.]|uniref:hypothetical protein n=1 Tax=Trichlorobacter sp. TaxID=2911007 RepID=UPI0025642854|nr:hypothetical protein [Trichlorobacter sp.]MDK9716630.1 hypothetical protein [Trichlorobacter sp.]